jgi:glycosyltransferase involved in cell wall biosynthesis
VKILTVVFALTKGGTENAAVNFALAYARLGHESKVLFIKRSGCRESHLLSAGIDVYDYENASDIDKLHYWKPNVIHIHSHSLSLSHVYHLKSELNPTEFWETNVFSSPSEWEHLIDKSFQLSEWCLFLYIRRGGDRSKAFIVPNPVRTNAFLRAPSERIDEFRSGLGFDHNSIILGRVGQAFEGKWSIHLISVFEKVRRSNKDVCLLIVDPPPSIINKANSSVYVESIRILDSIEDEALLKIVYSSIDIFVHIAGQGESFGMVLAESLLCGTPVVTLATPWGDNSQAEVVGKGAGGFVAASIEGVLTATILLCNNYEMRSTLGSKGRGFIVDTYDSLRVAQSAIDSGGPESTRTLCFNAAKIYYASNEHAYLSRVALSFDQLGLLPMLSGYEPCLDWLKSRLRIFLGKVRLFLNSGQWF